MYMTIDPMFVGIVLLLIYIVVGVIRNKADRLVKRVIVYSFVVYLLKVMQLTIGSFIIPPLHDEEIYGGGTQLFPFYFLWDLFRDYRHGGFDWFFWNTAKLSFYNFIMLMPLGMYIALLFKVRKAKWATFFIFLVSLVIETSQFIFSYYGVIMPRTFNVDDLLLNTAGGVFSFAIIEQVRRFVSRIKKGDA